MGNIAYKIPDELDEFDTKGYLKFELGELEFDTARENLSMTDKVKEVIKAKFASVKEQLAETAIQQIEAKTSPFERARLAEKLSGGNLGRFIGRKNLECYALPEPKESVTYWQSKYRGSEKYSTKQISADGDVKYYLHKDRMQTRIKSWLKDMSSGHTMYIFNDLAQAQECNIPVDLLEDLDDLPKIQRTASYSVGSTVKTFVFDTNYSGWKERDHWDETDLEIDTDEIVYVELMRFQPVRGHNLISNDNRQIRSTLSTLGDCGLAIPEVVGLKSAFCKTAKFRKGNFIHLDDYVKREFTKIAPKTYYEYDESKLSRVRSLKKRLGDDLKNNDVEDILHIANNQVNSKIADICRRLAIGSEMTKDTFLADLLAAFEDKYTMLTFVSEWEIHRHEDAIIQYMDQTYKMGETK